MCRVLKDFSVDKITISDSPALGSLEAGASKSGYDPLKKKYGIKITPLTSPVPFENEEGIPHLKIAACINSNHPKPIQVSSVFLETHVGKKGVLFTQQWTT